MHKYQSINVGMWWGIIFLFSTLYQLSSGALIKSNQRHKPSKSNYKQKSFSTSSKLKTTEEHNLKTTE